MNGQPLSDKKNLTNKTMAFHLNMNMPKSENIYARLFHNSSWELSTERDESNRISFSSSMIPPILSR